MRIIGLTGGIGAGKDIVAGFLRKHGAAIIDADQVSRDLTAPDSPLLSRIADEFGPGMIRENGSLDRASLARLIFSDAAARQRLNDLMHVPILSEVNRRLHELRQAESPPAVVVIVAPLLFEAKAESTVDQIIVVRAPEEVRLRRLKERDGLSEKEIRARFAAQLPPEESEHKAHWVIDNSGDLSITENQVEKVWGELI